MVHGWSDVVNGLGGGLSSVRRAHSGALGGHVPQQLAGLLASHSSFDRLALALDDFERDALAVEGGEGRLIAAGVVGAVAHARLLGALVQGFDRGRREAAAEGVVEAELRFVALDAQRVVVEPTVGGDPSLASRVVKGWVGGAAALSDSEVPPHEVL